MSAEATGWVFARSPMVGAGFAVHLAIADSVNDQHHYEFWMRMPNLAKKARLSRGAAAKAVAALCDAALLELVDDGVPGPRHTGSPRRFRMLMPDLPRLTESRAEGAIPAESRADDSIPRAEGAIPPDRASSCRTQEENPTRAEAERLCRLLAELMVGNGCKPPNITKSWVDEMDRMLRLDEREPERVENCIRWCQADSFWQANILSPKKLRAKYDQLRLAAKRAGASPASARTAERDRRQDLLFDEIRRHEEETG